jgi:Nucleotidyltransferase of unknown function (DUF6036)
VKRSQLEHVLWAAATIAEDPSVLIIGSQSILGTADEQDLPALATASMEVDVAFFNDATNEKSDRVDGAIGELSPFHEEYGYYAQGVSVTTARLPRGWRERLVVIDTDASAPGRGYCLEPHDCVISKLVAGREKDYAFAGALVAKGLVSLETLKERLALLDDVEELAISRIRQWLSAVDTG